MMPSWRKQPEVGSQVMRCLLVWIALNFGRSLVTLVLYPTVIYFLVFAPKLRSSSRDYLRRILKREPGLYDVCRHFMTFARCSIDRLYFLSGKSVGYNITVHGEDVFDKYYQQKRGAILIITHTGNFDVMRVRGFHERKFPIKILLSRSQNAGANSLFEQMDPEISKYVIDADRSANELVLEIHQALQDGFFVGIMADRSREGEKTVACQFLGARADFPASPWLISAVLKAPVILCFGFLTGARNYEVVFEEFSEMITMSRKERQKCLLIEVQRFVDRLQYQLKRYPYNWFNFYSFWCP